MKNRYEHKLKVSDWFYCVWLEENKTFKIEGNKSWMIIQDNSSFGKIILQIYGN